MHALASNVGQLDPNGDLLDRLGVLLRRWKREEKYGEITIKFQKGRATFLHIDVTIPVNEELPPTE